MRRRLLLVHPVRPAARRVLRRARRPCLRHAVRRPTRHVLPDPGPSLNSLFALCNRSLRVVERLQKKLNRPSRFKTIGTPEEHRRRMEEDLKRAYGDDSPFRSAVGSPAAASAPSSPFASPPAPQSAPGSQASSLNPQPAPKCDVMAVPLVSSPNGLLTLDWRRARPA